MADRKTNVPVWRRIEELRGVPVSFVVIDEVSPPITKERWDALEIKLPPRPTWIPSGRSLALTDTRIAQALWDLLKP